MQGDGLSDGGDLKEGLSFSAQLEEAIPDSIFIRKLINRVDKLDELVENLDKTAGILRAEIRRLEQLIKDLGAKP